MLAYFVGGCGRGEGGGQLAKFEPNDLLVMYTRFNEAISSPLPKGTMNRLMVFRVQEGFNGAQTTGDEN